MKNRITFVQTINYLSALVKIPSHEINDQITLRDISQKIRLVFASAENGARTVLFAPFLERPDRMDVYDFLDLQLLHLNADTDALGTLRICFSRELNNYALCDGELVGNDLHDFAVYVQEVLGIADTLHTELSSALAEGDDSFDAIEESIIQNVNSLIA